MSRQAFLPAGRALAGWLRAGPRPGPRAMLWAYRWKGFWFDSNWGRQATLHPAHAFDGDGRNLVFVMGFWRSGTTLLHELLAAGPGMAAPLTWQCMNPSAFRIAGAPPAAPAVARPMDALLVSAVTPQEDEFALLARGAPSVYRAWLDPRRWEETLPALEQDTWLALPESQWLADWRLFLGWCMPAGASCLVVKSPNHLFRLKALRRAWPRARFVWTLRDPAETWHSNLKMWRAMTALYGLWEWRGDGLDRLLFEAFRRYANALREIERGSHQVFLAFERLTDPGALEAVTQRLELGAWQHWRTLLGARLHASDGHRPEAYDGAQLPAYAQPLLAEIRQLHEHLLAAEAVTG